MTDGQIVKATASDGSTIEFVYKSDAPCGTMKQVFFAPQRNYAVALFHKPLDRKALDRLESLVGSYRKGIFEQIGGDYWKSLFCWPEKIVKCKIDGKERTGFTMPIYAPHFFFQYGGKPTPKKGTEKNGQWFTSIKHFRKLDPSERGNFLQYIRISLLLARAIRRLHNAGLAHSDLSYKNVLIDPNGAHVNVIDVDGLVVPGKYAPDVLGTAGFIAPEIICDESNPKKVLPSQATDRHALAVLIYMYLLHRHPLRGGRFFNDADADNEETLLMGKDPLYIEHPADKRNQNMKREYDDYNECKPWVDLNKFSAEKITGPFLADLFKKAFIDGLKDPSKRPMPGDWENALLKTSDRLLPCSNRSCFGKWFVFDNSIRPHCPFCGTEYKGSIPKLEFYLYNKIQKKFSAENYQLMVWEGQSLQKWHTNKNVVNNEKLTAENKKRVAYFQKHQGQWLLVNQTLPDLYEIDATGNKILKKPGEFIVLQNGTRILFSDPEKENGARLAMVQMAGTK